MRGLLLGAVGAAAVLCGIAIQPALAQRQCSSAAERATFEVQALRTELMVLAVGCNEDNRYNAFMRRFQGDLQANEREVQAYFKRKFGRSAQTEQDRFVTDMANARSRLGTDLGTDFCPRNSQIFTEVMALRSSAELHEFAAAKDLLPPALNVCQEVASAPPPKATTTHKR